jgi:hypothetical protein
MPTALFRPDAESATYTGFALTAGASKPVAVDPLDPISHDDATTYLTGTAGTVQAFTCAVPPIPGAKINTVTVYNRSRDDAGVGQYRMLIRLGGVDVTGSWTSVLPASTWVTSAGEELARPGGGSWTYADLATLEIGMGLTGDAGNIIKVTSLWAVIDYSTGYGFIFMPALKRRRG